MEKTELEPVVLKKVGSSLYFRVPAPFVKANDLEAGDYIILVPTRHFKILKAEDFEMIGRDPVLQPQNAA